MFRLYLFGDRALKLKVRRGHHLFRVLVSRYDSFGLLRSVARCPVNPCQADRDALRVSAPGIESGGCHAKLAAGGAAVYPRAGRVEVLA